MSLLSLYQHPSQRRLLLTGFLSFMLLGVSQALYGPAFPALQARFGVDPAEVGLIVSLHFVGSFTTILLSGLLLARFGYRTVLSAGALLMAAGSLGIAASPSWALVLAAALLVGFGFGVIEVAMNLIFARSFGAAGAPALNLGAALFGIGAVAGPLLVAAFLPAVGPPFLLVAVLGLIVVVLTAQLAVPEVPQLPAQGAGISLGPVLGFALLYFAYVASEVGVASWETTHLTPAFGASRAAFFTSLFWGAMTVGRFIATPISAYVQPRRLVLAATVLGFAAALLTQIDPLAPYAYALMGLVFAPIFPTSLVWLEQAFPRRAERLGPLVIAAAQLGAVASPPLIGLAVAAGGGAAVPTALAVSTFVLMSTAAGLWLWTRRA